MNDALMELVDSGQVEPQESYLKATDKVGIIHMLKQRGKDVSFANPDDTKGPVPPDGEPAAKKPARSSPAGK
jgi:hypothetical protein